MEIYNHNKIYQQNFFVFGHRGVPYLEPENTLNSFKKAIDLGYDGIEIDIMSTKDGVLIVNHDRALKIKTNKPEELVSNIDYKQLKNMPLLKDILSSVGHQTKINIEIKDQGKISYLVAKKMIDELKDFNLISIHL